MVIVERRERHLVTGGAGYVGSRLAKALYDLQHEVICIDVKEPKTALPDGIRFIKVDISSFDDILTAFDGVDCVYHLASYGMSGREQLNKKLIEEVNILGTENVLKACQKSGISRLVYTSTYNVVFGGQEIHNGNESLPYLPLDQHPDHYSRTKSIAEMKVLRANGLCLEGGELLRTCALRLAGVYGPGEERHLPRIVNYIQKGLFLFTYGSEDSLVDFLHIDNLVQAHLLAGKALKDKDSRAAGQAYFISDCKPINNFKFFRPLVEGLGYCYPKIRIPMSFVYFLAFITEIIHSIIGRIYNFQPFLTRTEVYKTGVTHYFSNDKAIRDLGYKPCIQNDLKGSIQWFSDRGYARTLDNSAFSTFRSIVTALALSAMFTICLLSCLPIVR